MEFCWNARSDTAQRVGRAVLPSTTSITPTVAANKKNKKNVGSSSRSALTADTADNVLHYEPEYKVLICKEHGYAVRNLCLHLRDAHTVSAEDRRLIVDKYAGLSLAKPVEVPLPPPLGPPFEALGQPIDALICDEEECGFISINPTKMRMHGNKKHDRRSKEGRREFWTRTKAQTFFSSSGL